MATVSHLKELSPAEFARFVSRFACDNFLQSAEMFARYQASGKEAYLLGNGHAAALVVKLSTVHGQKLFSLPGGPILDYSSPSALATLSAFLAEVKRFLRHRHGLALLFSPNVAVPAGASAPAIPGAKALGEYIQCKWISTLDLSKVSSADALFRSFRKGHRYSIKYTDSRFHLETRALSRAELPILKSLAEKAGEKHGFRDQSLKYYEEMFDAFGDKLKVLATFHADIPIAAAMFVLYGHEVVYLYSGADPAFNKYAGSYAIQWQMLQLALAQGFPRYNFYGVRPEPGNGVFEFKAGFRAEVEELWGTYLLPLSPLGLAYAARKKYHQFGEVA